MEISKLSAEARERRSAEIRAFLRSRRARLTPADVGMAPGSGRRTPGLRREEVAVLAGVGVSWYTWLEQGRDINVSADVLDAIGRVLQLDSAEREHLYLLAGLNPPTAPPADRAVPAGIRRVIDGWLPRPAYVIDRHWKLVAVNRAARLVFGYGERDHSCLVSFFTNAHFRAALRGWEDAARQIVGLFRADAARYPDDPEFGRLAEDMCAASPLFATVWAEHPVGSATEGVKSLVHPAAGELTFDYTMLPVADLPGARLLLYTPAEGTPTQERVAGLLAVRDEAEAEPAPERVPAPAPAP
ncbi:helix-turn-helix domain-containing protein [Streptomyces oryzae]|uniref:Helix-turn-helix domain-containing protein n=1 Tax=Streptomyces oryzae TaxID=1434886 RepID=A0ABS3X729_9ACTN|nr:helix-turn-helix transcriptional regulator [Streptomyces oryzae]MBO8191170.1 helix-turn-helix domain-containing protein [Streptomyces oryzae]